MDLKRIFCGLLLLAALKFCSSSPIDDLLEPRLECWEECISEANESLSDYEHFYSLGEKIRGLRLVGGHNATAFLLDASLDSKKNSEIFLFQKNLIILLTMMTPNGREANPFFTSIFNDLYSWSCDSWQCLGRCEAVQQIESHMNQDELSYHHNDEGRIEDACYLASKRFRDLSGHCKDRILNPMAVAVVNSPMDKEHVSSKTGCSSTFKSTFAIGTHQASKSQMKKWTSKSSNTEYVEYSSSTSEALSRLVKCMKETCCFDVNTSPPDKCQRTNNIARDIQPFDRNL